MPAAYRQHAYHGGHDGYSTQFVSACRPECHTSVTELRDPRNWQNWDLRLARRTTFSAATNYYCRMLGISTYESTLPIAYIDPDNPQDIVAYPGEEYYDGDNESDLPSSHDQKEPAPDVPKEIHRQTLLGFQPPSDKPMPGRRIRKAKSKKAAMRTVGADG